MKKLKSVFLSAVSVLLLASTAFSATSDLSIKSKQGSANSDQVDVELELWNNSSSAVDLNDVTIRYYFSSSTGNPYSGNIWYYDQSGANPKIQCSAQASHEGSDQFCDIIFDGNAPRLSAYSAVSIEAVFFSQPRRAENTQYDYSNPSSATSFTTNNKIIVYKNSQLVWGQEPMRSDRPISVSSYDGRGSNGYIMAPIIRVTNESQSPNSVKDLTVRYYIYSTVGAASTYTADMWYHSAPSTPSVNCYDMEVPLHNRTDMANMYCDVTFPYGGYVNGSSGFDLDYGLWNGSYQSQGSDWSWNGATQAVNKRVVVLINNTIIWGDVPR